MIEVFIDSPPHMAGLNFYIMEKNDFDQKRYILRFGKYNVSREEMNPYEPCDPTFSLAQDAGLQFLKSMAEKAAERGIKLESDLKREGKLEAVSSHLEDMRRLVFKKGEEEGKL